MSEEVSNRVDALEVAEKQQEDVWPLASSIRELEREDQAAVKDVSLAKNS